MSYLKSVRPDVPYEMTAPSIESQMIRRRRGHALGGYIVSSWSRGVGAVGAIDLGHGTTVRGTTTMTRPTATSTARPTTSTISKTPVKTGSTTITAPRPSMHVTAAQQMDPIPQKVYTPLPAPGTPKPPMTKPSSGTSTSTSSGGGGGGTSSGGDGGGGGGTPAPSDAAPMPDDAMTEDDPGDDLTAEPAAPAASEKKPMSTVTKLGLVAGAGYLLLSMFK